MNGWLQLETAICMAEYTINHKLWLGRTGGWFWALSAASESLSSASEALLAYSKALSAAAVKLPLSNF